MAGGGQPGNQNAARGREWRNAINRALEIRGNGDRTLALDLLAMKFLNAVEEMSQSSGLRGPSVAGFAELADRLDGKATQPVENKTELSGSLELSQRPQVSPEDWLKAHGVGATEGAAK